MRKEIIESIDKDGTMQIMFLDESGDHSLDKIDKSYPVFVLAGCIFEINYYNSFVEPEINKLKIKYFKNRDVIIRSYDIRKQKGDFTSLVDRQKRTEFLNDLNNLLNNFEYTIIAGAIHKEKHKTQYTKPDNPYDLCLQFIMERFLMFFGKKADSGLMRIESRETHNDKKLSLVYEQFRANGNNLFPAEEVQRKLIDLSFNQKIQNIAGHQIADLVAYPIGRYVLDSTKSNPAFSTIEKKFHRKPKSTNYLNYGLKIFP